VNVRTSHIRDLWSKPAHLLGCSVQKNFVLTVRGVELLLGIDVEGYTALHAMPSSWNMSSRLANASATNSSGLYNPESVVVRALTEAAFILPRIMLKLEWPVDFSAGRGRAALTTKLVFLPSAELIN
jgi:hypothetical protein